MDRITMASPIFNGKEKEYLNDCIDTGWISANGPYVQRFETEFADYCNTKYALACSNGTVTLHLILKAVGIGPGDEVIMPALTYIATANTVRYCGAAPVFVDCLPDSWNIDPVAVEKAITKHTKAIMPVHLYGLSADMTALRQIGEKHSIPIIEDAAEAHGAVWDGRRVGSIGIAGSFSFFGNKIITTGEGGMIVTNNEALYQKMKILRSQGMDPRRRYWHEMIGYNYRMTNMQAAVGVAQLENIEWHLQQRQRVAAEYRKAFQGPLAEYVDIQKVTSPENHVYWMMSIILKDRVTKSRDCVMDEMELRGIEMRPLFYPVYQMPPYLEYGTSCPIAERLSSRGINLPTHAGLNEEKISFITSCIYDIIKS